VFSFLSEKLSTAISFFSSKKKLTSVDLDLFHQQVRKILLDADVSLSIVTKFISSLGTDLIGVTIPQGATLPDLLMKKLYSQVLSFLGGKRQPGEVLKKIVQNSEMTKLMVVGLQGSGKTTTVAKLGVWLNDALLQAKNHKKIGIASVDIRRPAAFEQLKILADRAQLLFIHEPVKDNPHAVASIIAKAEAEGCGLLILDTAGRTHVDSSLMAELTQTRNDFKPTHTILVVDGMMGQEAVSLASAFSTGVSFDSVILTKLDSGARGGAAFGISYELLKPIYFMGTGEGIADLESFEPDRIASRIVGQGDIQSLLERVDRAVKREEEVDSAAMATRMMNGQMTLEDFAQQLSIVGSMGSISKLIQFIPGTAGLGKISAQDLSSKEAEFKKFKAILSSMTKKERQGRSVLDASRKKRVAGGAGVKLADVDQLIFKFEETKQFGRMIKKMGGFGNLFK
jgi:signal recognition particle subunit SRP54